MMLTSNPTPIQAIHRRHIFMTFAFIIFMIGLDQISKMWALKHLSLHQPFYVFPWLDLTLTMNKGVSFGMLSHLGAYGKYAFIALALIMGPLFAWWSLTYPQCLCQLGFALLSAGALGNVIDRIRFGSVVDFIDCHINAWHPFIFNLADAFINIGVGFILLDMLLNGSRKVHDQDKINENK